MKGTSPYFNGITNEACWYIIGAYLADGTISDISSHLDLSENTIQTVINNFKSTGIPSYRRKKGKFTLPPYHNQPEQQTIKENTTSITLCTHTNKRKAMDSDSDSNNKNTCTNDLISTLPRNKRSISKNKGNKNNIRRSNAVSDYLLSKLLNRCRIYENKRFELWQNEQSKKTIKTDDHSIKPGQSKPSILSNLPPTPSSQLSIQQQQGSNMITTPLSIITRTISDSSIRYHGINNNEFIPWTAKDDKILLGHLFYFDRTLKRWAILEQLFEGRHIANECKERWVSLAPILMNEMKNLNELESITPW
ncbi:unnamed protein product [Cunninghamella blakesleeana]